MNNQNNPAQQIIFVIIFLGLVVAAQFLILGQFSLPFTILALVIAFVFIVQRSSDKF